MIPVLPMNFAGRGRAGRPRYLLLAAVTFAHLVLLLALLWARPAPPHPVPRAALQLMDLGPPEQPPAATRPQPAKAEVTRPTPIVELPAEPPIAAVTEAAGAAQGDGAGGGCDLGGAVERALAANMEARAAVARIAPEARSVANAVVLWDGRWTDPALLGGAAVLEPIRRGIVVALQTAPSDCLPGDASGPRFIAIGDAAGATVLVLGSGRWRWAELLAEEPAIMVERRP